jgi:SAM-dependent methyltransferase
MSPWDNVRYWERRYRAGRSSGRGSEGQIALAKAVYVNRVIERESVASIIDWGVGDGTVMSHVTGEVGYTGVDISPTILARLRRKFGSRGEFLLADIAALRHLHADMALSMDVIFHLVNDLDYERYLSRLFDSANRFVLICSTDFDDEGRSARHVRHRHWTSKVRARFPQWILDEVGPWAVGFDDRSAFYLYKRAGVDS